MRNGDLVFGRTYDVLRSKDGPRGSQLATSQSRGFAIATIGLCAAAGLLRLLHVGHGLPDFTEEAVLFRKALELWGPLGDHVDLNPHWFVYPSLGIYLQLLAQHVVFALGSFPRGADFLLSLAADSTRGVVAGRCVAIIADVVTVFLVGRIARRYGDVPAVLAMAIVALSPTMIRTSRLIYTDNLMCVLVVAAVGQLLAYLERGGNKQLMTAAALIGAGAGAKYPAALLIIPLAIAVSRRGTWSQALRAGVLAAAVAGVAFLLTTPFVFASSRVFLRDLTFIGDTTEGGWLGKLRGTGLSYYLRLLNDNLGWVGSAFLVLSAVTLRRRPTALLWLCWLVIFAPIVSVPVEAERYLVSVIALSAILVAAGAAVLIQAMPRLRKAAVAGISLGLLAQPFTMGVAAATTDPSGTQIEARRWCQAHISQHDLVLAEAYGPNLLTALHRSQVMASEAYSAAGRRARAAYDSQWSCHMVWLPLLVAGDADIRLPTPPGEEVAVYPHVVDWNAAVYDIRLLQSVDYVITTGAVRGRFEADRARFPAQCALYAFLDHFAERAGDWVSQRGSEGPRVSIYRLTPRTWTAAASAGPLDSLWWARQVPTTFKVLADSLMGADRASVASDENLPLWVQALREPYAQHYGPFVDELSFEMAALGRWQQVRALAVSDLTILPGDVDAAVIFARSAGALGRWSEMAARLERTIAEISRQGPVPEELLMLQADALTHVGRDAEAARLLTAIVQGGDPESASWGRAKLAQLHGGQQK